MIETKESDQFPTDEWLLQVFQEWYDPWVLKGIQENQKGKRVVFLLKFDSTTKWYRALVQAGAHFIYVGERLHHGHKYASPFPSVLAILPVTDRR